MRRRISSVLLFILPLIAAGLFQLAPDLSDAYRQRIFQPLVRRLGMLSGIFPFPVAEILFFFLIFLLLLRGFRILKIGFRRCLFGFFRFLTVLSTLYVVLWFPLYHCSPAISITEPTSNELYTFCKELIASLNVLYADYASEYPDLSEITREAHALMQHVTDQTLAPPKIARYPELFSSLGIAGIYFPFTFETIINPDDIRPAIPFTVCHELAHQAGWAREEEASFIAWLACRQGSAVFQYAGSFVLLTSSMHMLNKADSSMWKQCVELMQPGVLYDFRSANGLNEAVPSRFRRIQNRISALFFYLNGQNAGLSCYDLAVHAVITWKNSASPLLAR